MDVSRSGRARKKSAKLIEMEESEVEFSSVGKTKGRKPESDTVLKKSPKITSPKAGTPKPSSPKKGSLSTLFPRVASVLESHALPAAAVPTPAASMALKFDTIPAVQVMDQEEAPLEIDVTPVVKNTKKKGKRRAEEAVDVSMSDAQTRKQATPSVAKKRKTKESKSPKLVAPAKAPAPAPEVSQDESDDDEGSFQFDDEIPEKEEFDGSGDVSDENVEFEKFLPSESDDTETDEDLQELERMRGSQVPALEGHTREPPKKKKEPPSFEKAEARKTVLKAKAKAAKKPRKEPAAAKKSRTTGYTLWCHSTRKQLMMQYPESDFAHVSRKLSELWQTVSAQRKAELRKRARAIQRKQDRGEDVQMSPQVASTHLRSGMPTPAPKPPPAPPGRKPSQVSINSPNYTYKVTGHAPIDVAAYLKLLGESLSTIGNRLQEHKGQIAVQGSLSVLLDSLLCALGSLTCLSTQVPQLNTIPADTHRDTLDNLAYIMPGIG